TEAASLGHARLRCPGQAAALRPVAVLVLAGLVRGAGRLPRRCHARRILRTEPCPDAEIARRGSNIAGCAVVYAKDDDRLAAKRIVIEAEPERQPEEQDPAQYGGDAERPDANVAQPLPAAPGGKRCP